VKVNHDGALMFEQPFVKVPHEHLRKLFKTSQRHIERDFTAIQKETSDVVKARPSNTSAVKVIDGIIGRVEGLKRKLSDVQTSNTTSAHVAMKRRLDHLAAFECVASTEQQEFSEWAGTRLDRWLVDWGLRNGREETAKSVACRQGISNLVDIGLFYDIHKVEEALRKHSCTEALMWCSQNKTALSKMKGTFEFDLRRQEFIELVRAKKPADAMAYGRKYLAPYLETHAEEVTHCMGLLACGSDTSLRRYKRLYDASQWTRLTRSFRAVAYNLNSLPSEPLLNLALYAGLVTLKLPSCYDPKSRNLDCPVCDGQTLGVLGKRVPWSHHVNSTIVCSISGRIMNEDNPPLCFPNGYVYSEQALKSMALHSEGIATCPRTGHSCLFSDLRKVYIT